MADTKLTPGETIICGILGSLLVGLLAPFLFILCFLVTLFHAWVLTYLWEWFVVPLEVVQIDIWQAFGLTLIAHLLAHEGHPEKDISGFKLALNNVLAPLIILFFGWVVHTFCGNGWPF
jgi:hypothetical protein